jgi:hypothetical protein
LCICHALRPRSDFKYQANMAFQYCPCLPIGQGLQTGTKYRGSITQPLHSLSTLRAVITERLRKTRFRLVANLYRMGFVITFAVTAHRVSMRSFDIKQLYIIPFSPASMAPIGIFFLTDRNFLFPPRRIYANPDYFTHRYFPPYYLCRRPSLRT